MDTPVLISHKTAWLVHHAPQGRVQAVAQHDYQIGARGLSTQQRIARIRQALTDCGIPPDMFKTIDISVVFAFERIRTNGVTCHVLGQSLPYGHIDELTPGIFITDEAFTFVLAAEWMDRIEYLEYGYEVCGDYRMGLNPSDPYTEQPATTSKDEIVELLDQHPGKPGATRARLALRHVYDHSVSPMEAASAIALSLPTSEGGVGIRGIELNRPLEIPQRLWHCTKARTLKIDALITYKRRELGIEYKGGFHDETGRKGADAEREAVLAQMGYHTHLSAICQSTRFSPCHEQYPRSTRYAPLHGCRVSAKAKRTAKGTYPQLEGHEGHRDALRVTSPARRAPKHVHHPPKTTFFDIFGGWYTCLEPMTAPNPYRLPSNRITTPANHVLCTGIV